MSAKNDNDAALGDMETVTDDSGASPRAADGVDRLLWQRVLALWEANRSDVKDARTSPVLVTTTGRGELVKRLVAQQVVVDLFEPEHYRFRLLCQALEVVSQASALSAPQATELVGAPPLTILCQPDPPTDAPYRLGVLGMRRDAAAEWSRDLLQAFASRIEPGGHLIVGVDHRDDQWLGDHLRKLVKNVKGVRRYQLCDDSTLVGATAYVVAGSELKVRARDFRCEFAFRDQGRLIKAVSRPGVFSHRRLDLGARRLMDAVEVPAGSRVLDIGCGAGVVAMSLAMRDPTVHVVAIDSSARAIECTAEGAEINQVADRVIAHLSSDGTIPGGDLFDVVVANPPYFARMMVAELFLAAAHAALKPGGVAWFVGKQPEWYQTQMPRWFDRVQIAMTGGGYCIATGTRSDTT